MCYQKATERRLKVDSSNIRAEMARHNETQEDIGKLVGLSAQCISRRLNGSIMWTIAELRELATHWGVSIDYLAMPLDGDTDG